MVLLQLYRISPFLRSNYYTHFCHFWCLFTVLMVQRSVTVQQRHQCVPGTWLTFCFIRAANWALQAEASSAKVALFQLKPTVVFISFLSTVLSVVTSWPGWRGGNQWRNNCAENILICFFLQEGITQWHGVYHESPRDRGRRIATN